MLCKTILNLITYVPKDHYHKKTVLHEIFKHISSKNGLAKRSLQKADLCNRLYSWHEVNHTSSSNPISTEFAIKVSWYLTHSNFPTIILGTVKYPNYKSLMISNNFLIKAYRKGKKLPHRDISYVILTAIMNYQEETDQ